MGAGGLQEKRQALSSRGPRHRKYQPFLDYPFADVLRLLHAVARHDHPRASTLEALRLLGRDTVRVFLDSGTGRMIRPLLTGTRESLLKMPEMWARTDPNNVTRAQMIAPDTVHFDIQGFEGWNDCGLIGTLEQVVMNHGCTPEVEIAAHSPGRVELRVAYRKLT